MSADRMTAVRTTGVRANAPEPEQRRYRRPRWPAILHNTVLAGLAILVAFPLVWMVSASFMRSGEANAAPPPLLPQAATLLQYRELFVRLRLGHYLGNSVLLASAVTLLSLVSNSLAGYAFAKLRFRGRDSLFAGLLSTLALPAQVAMLPLFLLLRSVGLVNTIWGVILPSAASVFGIFLVRQYARAIPDELLDAARVDGASELRVWWSVVLPSCRPILVTLALFTFLATWNDFLWPLIVFTGEAHYTLPVALANLSGEHVQDTELMMAGAVLSVLPVLILFLALQRQYIEGILVGSVKE